MDLPRRAGMGDDEHRKWPHDFRQRGPDVHARFVARLWDDLHNGHIGADFVSARIAELDVILARVEEKVDWYRGELRRTGDQTP